jgi:hypothetical protein
MDISFLIQQDCDAIETNNKTIHLLNHQSRHGIKNTIIRTGIKPVSLTF